MKKSKKVKLAAIRPDIFTYTDYLAYLKDWLAFVKASQSHFTIQDLSKKTTLSVSYLSMIFSGSRKLTRNSIALLADVMDFNRADQQYFESLVTINDSKCPDKKTAAYARMQSLRPYRKLYEEENLSYEYLANWYYVAIREMSALPGFKLSPEWIQSRLAFPVSQKEIKQGIEFLLEKKLIVHDENGKTTSPGSTIGYHGGIHRLALARFHKEMFNLAVQSIESVSTENRNILGFTLAVNEESFDQIKTILNETYQKIETIAKQDRDSSKVVHIELALFPLSQHKVGN